MANMSVGTAQTPKSPSRMDELLAQLSARIEQLGYAIDTTEAAANRLDGGVGPISANKLSVPDTPPRIALLGSLEDLSDRVERLTGQLNNANNRLSAAV